MDFTAILIWVGNVVFGMILGKPRPGVRLDTDHGMGFYVSGRGGFRSYRAEICIHAEGRATFTIREAGWIAGDGFEIKASVPREGRTLTPGGPDLCAKTDASSIAKAMRQHQGMAKVYVTIVGREKRFAFPIDNAWRARITEAEAKSGSY